MVITTGSKVYKKFVFLLIVFLIGSIVLLLSSCKNDATKIEECRRKVEIVKKNLDECIEDIAPAKNRFETAHRSIALETFWAGINATSVEDSCKGKERGEKWNMREMIKISYPDYIVEAYAKDKNHTKIVATKDGIEISGEDVNSQYSPTKAATGLNRSVSGTYKASCEFTGEGKPVLVKLILILNENKDKNINAIFTCDSYVSMICNDQSLNLSGFRTEDNVVALNGQGILVSISLNLKVKDNNTLVGLVKSVSTGGEFSQNCVFSK